MKISGSFDSNVLLRLTVNDLPHQTQQINKLIERGGEFVIDNIALVETMFVLERYYKVSRDKISYAVGVFMANPKIHMDKVLFRSVLPLFEAHPALSAEDCCLAVQAKNTNALPLWTFDKKLASQSSGLAKLLSLEV